MRRSTATAALLSALAFAPVAASCAAADGRRVEEAAMSDERAIDLARQACAGKVAIPADVVPVVTRAGTSVVVTFPTRLAPGTRGADYHARVTLDARSGRVVDVLVGS